MYSTKITLNGTITQGLTGSLSGEPTHSSLYCEGGWRSVSGEADIADIPANHIIDGMAALVVETGKLYTYKDGVWTRPTFLGDIDLDNATVGQVLVYDATLGWVSGQVGGLGILDGSIETDKVADGAITSIKIALNTISADNISYGAVTSDKIEEESITVDKIEPAYEYTLGKFQEDPPSASSDPVSGHYFSVGTDPVVPGSERYLFVATGTDEWHRVLLTSVF